MKLAKELGALTVEGELFTSTDLDQNAVQCFACAHRCKIREGNVGICKVRFNENGRLKVPHGYVGALQVDPIEKKPFFHAFPGSLALSFGMLGCDFKCSFCQNWDISQTLRDENAGRLPNKISAEQIVNRAKTFEARSIVSTYNEPLITSEWAVDIFKLARSKDFVTGYVSNGNATQEVLDYLEPHIDMYKIDLKTFSEREYRKLGGKLEAVLETIESLYKRGIWIEIVTLVIPGYNDSKEELTQMAEFISSLSTDIPWHLTGFHPDYKMQDRSWTSSKTLINAVNIAEEVGLNYIYAGNRPGMVESYENTRCSKCKKTVVNRKNFRITGYHLVNGRCKFCNNSIPGLWEEPPNKFSRIISL